jgi:hypothetical protein
MAYMDIVYPHCIPISGYISNIVVLYRLKYQLLISHSTYCFPPQVKFLVQELKHKLRPENAFFKALDFFLHLKEELHQLLISIYSENLLPATMDEIELTLRCPDTLKGDETNGEHHWHNTSFLRKDLYKYLLD